MKHTVRTILSHVSLHHMKNKRKEDIDRLEKIINKVPVTEDKTAESIVKDKKTYYVCAQCGRLSFRKIKSHGKVWCNKHYRQIKKYGHCLDDNPRTIQDRNEIHIVGDIAYIYLYDKNAEHIATGICDAEDVPKIRYTKWKLSASGYMMNTSRSGESVHFSRVILNTDRFVDHKNHNTLDNKKKNLRPITKSQNQMNANYKGVTHTKDNQWYAHIKLHGKMLNLGKYIFEEEGLFARWYAETLLFKEFRYPKAEPFLPEDRKRQIRQYVEKKVQRL